MGSDQPNRFPSRSPRESVAFDEGEAGSGCAGAYRMAYQVGIGFTQGPLERDGWQDVVFAFHDGEEIGPKMLARLAKHTGLAPTDLR